MSQDPTIIRAREAHLKALAVEAEALAVLHQAHSAATRVAIERGHLETVKVRYDAERETRKYKREQAADAFRHVYRFTGAVTEQSAAACMKELTLWSQIDPRCDIEVVFFSPGGSVTDGMALFDTIQLLRRAGHTVTTTAIGMAASMGGILLQAGDHRRMTKESWVLIHEISAGIAGSMGDMEDRVEWLKRIQERILDIFADRAKKSKAKSPLSRVEFKKRWSRKDWWLSSDECLKFGIVDQVI